MPPSSTPNPLVLVADPDVEYTALMGRQLEWAGYEVITTGDPAAVLELVSTRRPDALVIEANMPGATGYELVREVRSQPQNRLMPIVMISARAGKLDHDFAFTVGADDYVKKPFRYTDIVARLALLAPAGPVREAAPIARRGIRLSRPAMQPVLATR
jgi:two-component system phosphate regulon response regulator PhoB